jgi:hypothetical protein
MSTEELLNREGEVVVRLADGWSLRSGATELTGLTSGEYVRLCDPEGVEFLYWDQDEWRLDPALVMGAIINAAAGYRP